MAADYLFTCCTEGLTVSVSPVYLCEANGCHSFRLNVRIRNDREDGVQLLERHLWVSSDGRGTAEVIGPGVVGLQPGISQGCVFEYAGQALVLGVIGKAAGYYTFNRASKNGGRLVAHWPIVDLIPDGWLQ